MSKSSKSKSIPAVTTTAAATPAVSGFAAAYEATAKERADLRPEDLLPINLDVQQAVGMVITVLPKLKLLRAQIADAFVSFDLAQFDALETYAGALSYAHAGYGAASAPTDILPSIAARASELRELLVGDATTLARRGMLDAKKLDELKGGNGYLNVVSDLGVLSRMLRARWDAVQGRTAVQESELAEAQQLVETITVAHATRARASDEKSAAGSDRQRAYTLLVMAYEEARRATRWLRHYEDDVDTYLPSLWSGRSAKRNGSVVVAPVDTPVDDAPIVPEGDQPIVPLGDSPVVPLHG